MSRYLIPATYDLYLTTKNKCMGLFDKKYKPSTTTYTPANEQEAWLAIMHACIAVDEEVADEELEELSETLACKP